MTPCCSPAGRIPASRLDWIVVIRAIGLAAVTQPYFTGLDPRWITAIQVARLTSPNLLLGAAFVALLCLCVTRAWNPVAHHGGPALEPIPARAGRARSASR